MSCVLGICAFSSEVKTTGLQVLMRGDTRFDDGLKVIEDAIQCRSLSLATVLDAVEASNTLPEAAQPPGLAVGIQLRRYQRQSLAWMIERELRPLRDALWWDVASSTRTAGKKHTEVRPRHSTPCRIGNARCSIRLTCSVFSLVQRLLLDMCESCLIR